MSFANFRTDNATGVEFKSLSFAYSGFGTYQDVFTINSGKAAIIDSIYVHSEETTRITKLTLSIHDVGASGSIPPRPFFVARIGPKETVLCASKSTPIAIESGQKIIMGNAYTSFAAVAARVFISYREYDLT